MTGSTPAPSPVRDAVPDGISSVVNALFAVGLELAAVRCLVDGEAGCRIDRAIDALDDAISDVRSVLAAPVSAPNPDRRPGSCSDVCAFADPVWE